MSKEIHFFVDSIICFSTRIYMLLGVNLAIWFRERRGQTKDNLWKKEQQLISILIQT
jgi:hypothetical protein